MPKFSTEGKLPIENNYSFVEVSTDVRNLNCTWLTDGDP